MDNWLPLNLLEGLDGLRVRLCMAAFSHRVRRVVRAGLSSFRRFSYQFFFLSLFILSFLLVVPFFFFFKVGISFLSPFPVLEENIYRVD